MAYLSRIILLCAAANLNAQETGETGSGTGTEPESDPIAAEVFADDIVMPPVESASAAQSPQSDASIADEPVEDESIVDGQLAEEVFDDGVPEDEVITDALPPIDEQIVPVAEDGADTEEDSSGDLQELPDATDEQQLNYQYSRYINLMHDHVYDEADSVAKRVVELTLNIFGPKSTEFSKALINLAIVQDYNLEYGAAEQNFTSAIEIIENNEDRLNQQLVNPLKGLGASQLEGGRPDLAMATFQRAVHVTHVNDGPHNLNQIELLELLAETQLRLGAIDEAREIQDMIYTLNARAYDEDTLEFVPSLLRRAAWQHRSGLINDERTSLRRAVRIIEDQVGEDDLQLVDPLIQLGRTFYYIDASGSVAMTGASMASGELYFKRAVRIATENPQSDWQTVARSSLALGDFYMFEDNMVRADVVYKETWEFLSEEDERLDFRRDNLERPVLLRERPLPQYVTPPSADTPPAQRPEMLNGSVTLTFTISAEGRAANLKVLEVQPANFEVILRSVQRQMRSRLYRPRFVDAEPVATEDQMLRHRFFYTQSDLDAVHSTTLEETGADET